MREQCRQGREDTDRSDTKPGPTTAQITSTEPPNWTKMTSSASNQAGSKPTR